MSRRLAARFGYTGEDITNLQRVALYAQYRAGGTRKDLVDAIASEIARGNNCPDGTQIEPSPALQMLAALPWRMVITTNYDQLFDMALSDARTAKGRRKRPILRVYDPNRTTQPDEVTMDPTEEEPILLKLHGDIQMPETIVVTEEDYITFIQRMASPHLHPIHENIRVRMKSWPFLFVGYSLKDYNLRLLFRTLRWGMDIARCPLSYSVDPFPDNIIVAVWQRGPQPIISFIQQDLWSVVPALYRAVLHE